MRLSTGSESGRTADVGDSKSVVFKVEASANGELGSGCCKKSDCRGTRDGKVKSSFVGREVEETGKKNWV